MPDAPNGVAARARLAASARGVRRGRGDGLRGGGPSFSALCAPPAWLATDAEVRARIGVAGALLRAAPALRRMIDGAVLGPLAEAFGEDLLGAVLEAEDGPDRTGSPGGLGVADVLRDADALVRGALGGEADAVAIMDRAAVMLSGAGNGAERDAAA